MAIRKKKTAKKVTAKKRAAKSAKPSRKRLTAVKKKVATKKFKTAVKKKIVKAAARTVGAKGGKKFKAKAHTRVVRAPKKAVRSRPSPGAPRKRPATKAVKANLRELYKVVKRGTDAAPKSKALVSIFTRPPLRLTYSSKRFTKAPSADLPITGFDTYQNAQRFVERNENKIEHPWVIVKGVGEPADEANVQPRRLARPCDLKSKSLKKIAASVQEATASRRTSKKWSRGTVFVKNFKIVEERITINPASNED